MEYFDAHCHLQDPRIVGGVEEFIALYEQLGVRQVVVNGTSEADWEVVAELCGQSDVLRPSFGLHPWKVAEASGDWQSQLLELWNRFPEAAVGEVGLDRWIEGHDLAVQEPVFLWQLRQARERELPISIHCLRAWGRLLELLKTKKVPERGFLLHSYGGPKEMVVPFVDQGAYFSISGYFAHDRKTKQREALKCIPLDRVLVETDAPDMKGPDVGCMYKLSGDERLNHPGNITSVYSFAAALYEMSEKDFAAQISKNYRRFFDIR